MNTTFTQTGSLWQVDERSISNQQDLSTQYEQSST